VPHLEPETAEELESCPFCAGREDRTPPETLRLGDGPTGWRVRVVPNLYPALERQEVVVHGPEHHRSVADVDDGTLELVAEAWQRRARDAGGTMFAFINEGARAGASLAHTHSQLAWLPAPAPAAVAERGLAEVEPVLTRDGVVAGCPRASRVPYELQIAPEQPEPAGLRSERLAPALRLLAECVRRVHCASGARLAFNA
jgi:UDPglucose--hexose-1-phosphate uridylyltransferase